MRSALPTIVSALLLALAAPLAAAPRPAEALVAELAHEEYATRERAMRELLVDDSLTPKRIAELYGRAKLPEQRQRLLNVAMHHLVRVMQEERSKRVMAEGGGGGSLGISIGTTTVATPGGARQAPAVGDTLAGFPAHVHLRPGDVILEVDGREVRGAGAIDLSQALIQMIQSRAVGEVLRLTILRQGERMEVRVPLASAAAMKELHVERGRGLTPLVLDRWLPYRRALEQKAGTPPPLRLASADAPAADGPRPGRGAAR